MGADDSLLILRMPRRPADLAREPTAQIYDRLAAGSSSSSYPVDLLHAKVHFTSRGPATDPVEQEETKIWGAEDQTPPRPAVP
jgi:hypothetical protein